MKSKLINTLCGISTLLCLIIGATSIHQAVFLVKQIKSHPLNPYIYLVDKLDDDAFYNFRLDPQRTDKLLELNANLKSSPDISFIELRRDKIIFNQIPTSVFFVGSEAFNHFNLIIQEGNTFNVDDYNYSLWNTSTISIILGNDYRNIYNIGDTILLNVYGTNINGKVIGFLTNDSTIVYQNDTTSTNNYILLPYENIIEVATTEDEKEFQFKMLLDKNNGVVVSKMSKEDVLNLVNGFARNISPQYYSTIITSEELLENLKYRLRIAQISCISSLLVCVALLIIIKKRMKFSRKKFV